MYRPIASLLRCAGGSIARQSVKTGGIIARQSAPAGINCPSSLRQLQTSSILQYDKELFSFNIRDAEGGKKYFIDLKEGKGKYVKISEVSNGKRATMMVDLKDLSMFTSKLMVAEGGEMVGTLKTEQKSFDFKKVSTDQGSHVEVTENSERKYKVILTSKTVPDIIIALVKIDAEISSKLKMSGNEDCEDDKPKSITLRTIMTGPEAGSIIGRGGEIVNSIRDESGAKIRIEGSSPQERIITVDGPTDSIFKVSW